MVKKVLMLIMMAGGILLHAAEHDFNGDGYSDILWKKADGRYTIWEMGPEGRRSANPLGKELGRKLAGTGDFDGDGHSDILWNWGHNTYVIEKMGSESSEDLRIRTKKGWSVAGTGDFDGDGRSDILWNRGKDDYIIWKMGPDGKTGTIPVGKKKGWSVSATGDVDGDGCSDILWRRANGSYTIWKMGAEGKVGTIWPQGKKGWSAIAMGDFDGDGYSDILWYRGNETYIIWRMDPDGIKGTIWIGKKMGWIAAATGDFDGDGHSDILWNNGNDAYNIWKMGAEGKIGSILIGKKPGWKVAGRDKIWKRPLHQMPEFYFYTSEKGRVGGKITIYDIDGDPLSDCDFYTEYLDMTADSSGALYFVGPQGIVMKYRDGAPTTVDLGKGALRAVEAVPEKNRLYVLGYDGKIYIVDSRLLTTTSSLSSRALYLKIEVLGRRLFALRSDGVLEIFDTKTDRPIAELKNAKGLLYTDFAASSSKIALKTHNGILDLYAAKELSAEGSYKLAIERMALYRNHLYVASGKKIRIVDLDTKEIVGSAPFIQGKTMALHLDRKKGLLLVKDAQNIKVYKIKKDGSLAGIENIDIYPGVPYTDSFLYETDGIIYPGYSVKAPRIASPIPIRNNWHKHSFSMEIDLPTATNAKFYFPGNSL
ncbi:FG-GAP repeat domain-containing protein, partial [Nitratifractor sp.]